MTPHNNIPLSHLPLRPSSLQLMQQRGFTTVKELNESKKGGMANLAAELNVPITRASQIWHEVQSCMQKENNNGAPSSATNYKGPVRASGLLQQEVRKNSAIITFSRAVDQILGGGLQTGELTELAGAPGTGKTAIGMQLAVDARLSLQFGGVGGETVYVDTEGSFSPERCHTMATALIQHIHAGLKRRGKHGQTWNITADEILEGIHVYRVHDEAAQQAVLTGALPAFVKDMEQAGRPVKLVVIDSMAFHYRAASPDSMTDYWAARTRQLTATATLLSELAAVHDLAVVAINQMTTKITAADSSKMVPALGESWAHAVTTRLVLSQTGKTRTCALTKSPRLPCGQADYQVTEYGIRGVEYMEASDGTKRQRSAK